jgi:type IV pilus assembly protein PilM
MGLFAKKEQSHLGVDIGAHGIKVVELKKTKGRPQLWTYGMTRDHMDIHADAVDTKEPMVQAQASGMQPKEEPESDEDKRIAQYGDQLKVLLEKAKVQATVATASLPVSQVFHTLITLPLVDAKEIDHHVRAKVKKMLPLPIDHMQVVHQEVPHFDTTKKETYKKILVTAAPRRLVSFYARIFQRAGLQLDELETEAFALQRALVGNDPATTMIIDIGAERANFFIVDQTLPLTHRSIQVGGNNFDAQIAATLGISPQEARALKYDFSKMGSKQIREEIFASTVDPIIKEISYNVEMFTSQTGNEGKRMQKIIFTGGASLFPPIVDHIRQAFPVNVFIGDPWARIVYQQGLKRILDEIGPRMAVAAGLSMRNIV